jgi:superfamily II DNA or RNA helicase
VPALHYGPDEPDLRAIGRPGLTKEISEESQRKVMGKSPALFGRVFDWFKKLNPDCRPSILFAAGVPESVWFAEEFSRRGVRAAHIDGQDVYLDGELIGSSKSAREDVLGLSLDNRVKVLCNRFVLREGVDAPWLYHGVFATVFGSLTSYLQSGGRLLRAHQSLDHVVVQDHGGNWWRYGSLNADRTWTLGDTAAGLQARREDGLRDGREEEPRRCPACGLVVARRSCVCGYEVARRPRMRPVAMSDGSLVEVSGRAVPPRQTRMREDTVEKWKSIYFASVKAQGGAAAERTFRQARGLFFHREGYWPPETLPFMPLEVNDWYRAVKEVPTERLIKGRG